MDARFYHLRDARDGRTAVLFRRVRRRVFRYGNECGYAFGYEERRFAFLRRFKGATQ